MTNHTTGPPDARGDSSATDQQRPADAAPVADAAVGGTGSAPGRGSAADGQQTVISKRPPASLPTFRQAATPFEMGQLLEGERLGPFQLEEFVGGGGMGAVFRATDTALGRTVAVKVVSQHQTDQDTLRRFRNEAQSAARLDHPHIARVYFVGEDKGWDYIVFEYIEGINVRDLVAQIGPLTLADTISYTVQVADALEHASRRAVIHRDIKPSNILIMADGRAKVVDMGLARLHQVESTTNDLTASGVTLGTFDYISPEQANDPRNTDVRSDLYSLGCTVYFMLTGQPPFPDGTMLQKLLKHSSVDAPDPRHLRPDLPDSLAAIVKRLLAKAPKDRPQSPRALINDLLAVADQLDISGIHPVSPLWPTSRSPRIPLWARYLPWAVPIVLLLGSVVALHIVSVARTPIQIPAPRLATGPLTPSAVPQDTAPAVTADPPAGPGAQDADPASSPPAQPAAQPDLVPPQPVDSSRLEPGESTAAAELPENGGGTTATPRAEMSAPAKAPTTVPGETPPPGDERRKTETSPAAPEATRRPAASPGLPEPATTKSRPEFPADRADDAAETLIDPLETLAPAAVRLVVTDQPGPDQEGVIQFTSLQAAIERFLAGEPAAEIELQFDGPRLVEPLQVDLRMLPERNLVIRGSAGRTPTLVFRPPTNNAGNRKPRAMLELLGGHTTWIDVQFHFVVPPAATPVGTGSSASWAMWSLRDIERVEFRHCVLTVQRTSDSANAAMNRAVFFDLEVSEPLTGSDLEQSLAGGATPTIWMERSIARGQATLVRADRALPFLLFWDQGALFTTERMLEMGGTPIEPHWEYGRATMFLQRLLATVDQGICLLKTESSAPYQLGLAANCYDCLFVTAATDPPTPLYELRSGSVLEDDAVLLDLGGANNYYKNTKIVLRVQTVGATATMQQYAFDDLAARNGQPWYNEKGAQPGTMFTWPEPARPADQRTLQDFLPADGAEGALKGILNITPLQLPQPMPVFDAPPLWGGEKARILEKDEAGVDFQDLF